MKYRILGIVKSLLCVALMMSLCFMTWTTVLSPVLRPISKAPVTRTTESIINDGPTQNRHILITEINSDVLPLSGFISLRDHNVTYIPLIPKEIPGKPLATDYRLFYLAPEALDEAGAKALLANGELTGDLRLPKYHFSPKRLNEDRILAEWNAGKTEGCWVLEPHHASMMNWKNPQFLFVAGMSVCLAFYAVMQFVTCLIHTKLQAGLTLIGTALLLTQGVLIYKFEQAGPALWNTVSPVVMITCLLLGSIGLVLTACRLLTLTMRHQSNSSEETVSAPSMTGTEPFQMTKVGFILRDRDGERDYLDVDVIGFKIKSNKDANGTQTRTFRLRIQSGKEVEIFSIADEFKEGQADPLAPFFARLLASMVRIYRTKLQAGEALTGDNWTFSLGGFSIGNGVKTDNFSHHTITSTQWVGLDYRIWTAEQEQSRLCLPSSGDNVHVLSALLKEMISKKTLPTTSYKHQLGRLLQESKFSMDVVDLSTSCFCVGLIAGIVALSGIVPGMVPIVIAGIAILAGCWLRSKKAAWNIKVFDNGFVLNTGREVSIPFTQVTNYSVRSSAQKNEYRIVCQAMEKPLEFNLQTKNIAAFNAASMLEEQLNSVVSNLLLKQLVETGSTEWTAAISITLKGLQITQQGQCEKISFKAIDRIQIDDRMLKIQWNTDKPREFQIARTENNVLAGYKTYQKVLEALQLSHSSEPAAEQPVYA